MLDEIVRVVDLKAGIRSRYVISSLRAQSNSSALLGHAIVDHEPRITVCVDLETALRLF